MPCSLLHIEALGKPRRLGLLGASVNKNKYIFLVDLVAHFLKIRVAVPKTVTKDYVLKFGKSGYCAHTEALGGRVETC